jgi:hypothetical protein
MVALLVETTPEGAVIVREGEVTLPEGDVAVRLSEQATRKALTPRMKALPRFLTAHLADSDVAFTSNR